MPSIRALPVPDPSAALRALVDHLQGEVAFLRQLTEHQAGQVAELRRVPELTTTLPPRLDELIATFQDSTSAPLRRSWWRRLFRGREEPSS